MAAHVEEAMQRALRIASDDDGEIAADERCSERPVRCEGVGGAYARPSVLEDRVDLFTMVLAVAVPARRERGRAEQRNTEPAPYLVAK
jgi:hypothetical protein